MLPPLSCSGTWLRKVNVLRSGAHRWTVKKIAILKFTLPKTFCLHQLNSERVLKHGLQYHKWGQVLIQARNFNFRTWKRKTIPFFPHCLCLWGKNGIVFLFQVRKLKFHACKRWKLQNLVPLLRSAPVFYCDCFHVLLLFGYFHQVPICPFFISFFWNLWKMGEF